MGREARESSSQIFLCFIFTKQEFFRATSFGEEGRCDLQAQLKGFIRNVRDPANLYLTLGA